MLIGSRQKLNIITDSPVVSINGTPVNHVLTSKSLGVLIDGNLTWGSHIEKLAKIIASGIAAIKRVGQFVLPSSNIASYLQSLDWATFRLLNVVWGNCGVKLADKLQKLTWSQQTSDHSNKISLLIANLEVATLRLAFVKNYTTSPLLLYTSLIKLQSLRSFHAKREN